MTIVINLPIPPSLNNLFANAGKRRVTTPRYAAWLEEAGLHLNRQRPEPVAGWYELFLYLPAKIRGDVDNRLKGVSDLLSKHSIIEDDSLAWAIHAIRDHRVEGECQAVIRPVCDAERGVA